MEESFDGLVVESKALAERLGVVYVPPVMVPFDRSMLKGVAAMCGRQRDEPGEEVA